MFRRPASVVATAAVSAAILAPAVAGCGGSVRPAPPPPVRLTIESPLDGATTLAPAVLVRGKVVASSAATVLVSGQRVAVRGGSFSAQVAIRAGTNVIDVLAGAPRARAAMSALRVYRELPVAVPDVSGESTATAISELRGLGLRPQVSDESSFFQSLLPLSKQVCATQPAAGRLLAPGSAVTVQVAKVC